jgi:hypothetical protein
MHGREVDGRELSKFEQACRFKAQYEAKAFKSRLDFAKAMNLSVATVSNMLAAAELAQQPWFNEFVLNKAELSVARTSRIAVKLRKAWVQKAVNDEIEQLRVSLAQKKHVMTTLQFINYLEEIILQPSHYKKKLENISSSDKKFLVKMRDKGRLCLQILPGINRVELERLFGSLLDVYYD